MLVIFLLLATIIPLIFLSLVYWMDLYQTGEFRSALLCFIWGLVTYAIASVVNIFIIQLGWMTSKNVVCFVAPLIEEILKAMILIYLARRSNFIYFVDGAIFGFSTGIGFAIMENYQYILAGTAMNLSTTVGLVVSTNLMHASASAIVGIAAGIARFQRSYKHTMIIMVGLIVSILLHMTFNIFVTNINNQYHIFFAAIISFCSISIIALMIQLGLLEEKKWIEEKLGKADRVTVNETALVLCLDNVQEIIAPVVKKFGPDKAEKIEKFLLLQARLGILRKTIDKSTGENMRQDIEQEMTALREDMDKTRRELGIYCMLYLRNIFPQKTSPLWDRLEELTEQHLSAQLGKSNLNLWSVLDNRVAKSIDVKPGSLDKRMSE